MGCLPIVTEGVRCSAFSRVKAAFPPGRAGHITGTEYRSVPSREGIQSLGYRHSRPTRGPGRGGVVRSRLRICDHGASRCEALVRSKTAFAGVGTPVVQFTAAGAIEFTARIPAVNGEALRLFSRKHTMSSQMWSAKSGIFAGAHSVLGYFVPLPQESSISLRRFFASS
jgi:hypothetical protein